MLSLCKTPMSLSSAQLTGNFLRRRAPLSKIKAIVVPKLSNKTGQRVQAARLLSQFYGSKLHNKNLSFPHHNSYGEGLSRRSAAHLMAVSYAESNPSRQNNDVSVDNLKVSQIKKVCIDWFWMTMLLVVQIHVSGGRSRAGVNWFELRLVLCAIHQILHLLSLLAKMSWSIELCIEAVAWTLSAQRDSVSNITECSILIAYVSKHIRRIQFLRR